MFNRTVPKVSIIIPSWFTKDQKGKYGDHETFWFASKCINRLKAVTPKIYELIIIDNGSTLHPSDINHPEINPGDVSHYWTHADILIRNKENLGFAPACNQGFALARGEYIICLNNDILMWHEWLDTMISDFENLVKDNQPCGVLMPALEKTTRDAREALKLENPDLTANRNQFGPGAEFGSLWMMSREVFDKLLEVDGYIFDEVYKVGFGEDRDLWERVRAIGYDTYRTHNTRVFHQGNMSMGKVKNRRDYTEKNREILYKKYPHRRK